jgi:hypothetical protein
MRTLRESGCYRCIEDVDINLFLTVDGRPKTENGKPAGGSGRVKKEEIHHLLLFDTEFLRITFSWRLSLLALFS